MNWTVSDNAQTLKIRQIQRRIQSYYSFFVPYAKVHHTATKLLFWSKKSFLLLINISTVCLHFWLFVYIFSCLCTISVFVYNYSCLFMIVVYLYFQLFVYNVSCSFTILALCLQFQLFDYTFSCLFTISAF